MASEPMSDAPEITQRLSFLATKIAFPRHQRGVIARDRLISLVDDVESHLVSVVHAPSGFGKTTLATAWADALRGRGHRVGWLRVDAEDSAPQRFLHYLHCCALKTDMADTKLLPEHIIGQMGRPAEDLRAALHSWAADCGEEIFLFIDDYQFIANAEVHEHVLYLLVHAPSNLHLIFLSWNNLPFSLARQRSQGQVFELDAASLRFTHTETASLIHASDGREEEIAVTHSATQGWPAALRIASISRGHRIRQGAPIPTAVDLKQSLDELIAGWLLHLPADELEFLEKIAVVDRFCAPLCEALTGNPASGSILARLESQEMMVTRLADDTNWLAFHPLFREALLSRLRQRGDKLNGDILRRASDWHAANALWSEALKYAFAAGDTALAVRWIAQCVAQMIFSGDMETVFDWEQKLRAAGVTLPLEVRFFLDWAHSVGVVSGENFRQLDAIEQAIRQQNPPHAAIFLNDCKAIRAILLTSSDDIDNAYLVAKECLEQPNSALMQSTPYNVLFFCYVRMGRWKEFYALSTLAAATVPDDPNIFNLFCRKIAMGLGEFTLAHTGEAQRHLAEAKLHSERYTGPHSVFTAWPVCVLSLIHYEKMEFEAAENMMEERLATLPMAGLEASLKGYIVAARIAFRQRQDARAYALLDRADMLGQNNNWPRLMAAVTLERARFHLEDGQHTAALGCVVRIQEICADHLGQTVLSADLENYAMLAKGYCALAENQFEEASVQFANVYNRALSLKDNYLAIGSGAALALAQFKNMDKLKAFGVLRRVVEIAAPAGIKASILAQDRAMPLLLAAFRDSPERGKFPYPHDGFLDALLDAEKSAGAIAVNDQDILLSKREIGILENIANDKSNKEIANIYAISPETVKTHIKRVFAKLSVTRRVQAVRRARSLGLIGPENAMTR
jgi:LuxR family maltose regulon positive regulatory protein